MPATSVPELTILCDGCTTSTPVDQMIEANPVFWRSPLIRVCPTCRDAEYFQCDDCDVWYNINNRYNGPEGALVCGTCYNSYFTCTECNICMHSDNHQADGICSDCYVEIDSTTLIHEYNYRPKAAFFGTGPHFMGVELEVEVVRGELDPTAQSTLDLLGKDFVYLKRDGSINNGFEIVSHPASLAHHRKMWEKFFAERPSGMRSHDVENCGLHVHTSRDCLSELTIGKMLAFVNSANNANFVKAIARRESRDYARLQPGKKVSDVKQTPNTRYEAINLVPEKTVEFRIFKGTLNKDSFFLALEFVQCLIDFCKPAAHSITECIGNEAFFKFVSRLHSKKPMTDEKIAKLGIDKKALEKRAGSSSHPYPHLAKFCREFGERVKKT